MPLKKYYTPTGRARGGSAKGSHSNASLSEYSHIINHYRAKGGKGPLGIFEIIAHRMQAESNRAAKVAKRTARAGTAFGQWAAAAAKEAIGKSHRTLGRISVMDVCRFLEFGTSKMGKKPFMNAAWEEAKQPAIDAITNKIKAAIIKAAA